MRFSLSALTKKAIDAALNSNWKKAVELNSQIIEAYPNNLETKIRLGRAYIQTKNFNEAKKLFKEVLEKDPINSIAKKNLELAKAEKVEKTNGNSIKTKALLKEPGTTQEINFEITTKRVTADSFNHGEELFLKVKKKSIDVYRKIKEKRLLVGKIENEYVVNRVNSNCNKNGKITATFTRGKNKKVYTLIKCSIPVFKADKLDIRPYLKKGSIDEPEINMNEIGNE